MLSHRIEIWVQIGGLPQAVVGVAINRSRVSGFTKELSMDASVRNIFVAWIAFSFCQFLEVTVSSAEVKGVAKTESQGTWNYPNARRADQVDTLHGTKIPDPYRWLEEPDSEETRAWVAAQNKLTFGFLESIPQRAKIKQRLTELWNYERYGTPSKKGGRYFYTRNDGLQNQSVLYVAETLDAPPRVLLDPNQLSGDGTVALSGWRISDDGQTLAYGVATAGSDWNEWRFRDITTGKDLEDKLRWIKFSSASFTPDGRGVYYSRYDEPKSGEQLTGTNYFQKLYFHRLGDPQEKDTLIYHRDDQKEWGFAADVTDDGRYLAISVWRGSTPQNQLFYRDLQTPEAPIVELIAGFDSEYDFIGNDGPIFWVVTDNNAPLRRILAIDIRQPERSAWRTLVPESKDKLESVNVVGDQFIATYLHNACSLVKCFDLRGALLSTLPLPGPGTVSGFHGRRQDRETFYAFTNYIVPGTILRYDTALGTSTTFREPKVAFRPENFVSEQVFYTSRDGTRVPMTLTYRRDLKRDGSNPTILYGYGGFNVSVTPGFSASNIAWLELGGVYAVPNLRGGGEFGREWHEAGMKLRKQNVFDDFIAAAEWLIEQHYTSPEKLAIRGGSNGGLLVGAAMTQRPELFKATIPMVGVMDMLRYHKFTIGWAWVPEFGSADNAEEFAALLNYSPLHNIKPATHYPATLVTTADHDDRVVPAHSYKFAAALQAAQAGPAPTLIRIETRAGHGAGTPTTKLIDAAADVYAFLAKVLDVPHAGGN